MQRRGMSCADDTTWAQDLAVSGIAGVISASNRPVNLSHFWNSLQLLGRCDPSHASACEWRRQSGLRPVDFGRGPADPQSTSQAVVGFCWDQNTLPDASQQKLSVYVAHDCEAANLPELAREVGLSGSPSCSLILSAGLEKWGSALFGRLQGPFAIAAVQPSSGHLLLARDRLGIRPLFYHCDPDTGFHFSSHVVSLLTLARLSRQIRPSRLWDYLTTVDLFAPEETIFRGVQEAPAGSVLKVSLEGGGAFEASRFGNFTFEETKCSVTEAGSRLKELLFESVRRRSSGCGPLGITLSGGLDSSAVAASAAQLRASSQGPHAFTFAPNQGDRKYPWSEEAQAQSVAKSLGIRCHSASVSSSQIAADFAGLIQAMEFPFSSPVLFANLQLLRMASDRGVELVLNGHGPDILFGGGAGHIHARAAGMARKMQLFAAWKVLRPVHRHGSQGSLRTMRVAAGLCLPTVKRILWPGGNRAEAQSVIQRTWFRKRLAPAEQDGVKPEASLDLKVLRLRELTQSVLPRFVRYERGTSVMTQVRNASPFLDDEIVDFALTLPVECLVAEDGLTKVALRKAMQGLLPDEVLASRRRVGFPVPAEQWLRDLGVWAREYLLRASESPFLDGIAVRRQSDDFFEGRSAHPWSAAMTLWKLILLSGWIQTFDLRLD
jgi:asparagine synthase (glutamine-hydrolysing)